MSPSLRTESPPRRPGCLNGRPPKQYPAGRVCVACPTVLRRTNPGPWCDPCLSNDAKKGRGMDRQKREAAVLEYLRTRDGWITSVEIAKALGIPKGTLTGTLGRLVDEGTLVSRKPALGGGYRTPATGGVVTSILKTAPDPPPASAPVIPPPEQPADVAPAPEFLGPQAGLAPTAGIKPFAGIDVELLIIGDVVRRIESLTGHETRVRVAAYVASRFL